MSYGTFESVASDGYEDNLREAAAVQSLDHAIERVSQRFGSFLCQATDRDDFNERVALLKPEIMKVVEAAGVMPVSGVMRKVVGSQKAKWRKVAEGEFPPQQTQQQYDPAQQQQYAPQQQAPAQQQYYDPAQYQAPVQQYQDPAQQQYQDPAQYQAPVQQYQAPAQQYAPQQQAPAEQQQYAPAQEQDDTYTAGLEDAKDLVPSDDWDGYLQERDTPEREQIKTRNFNPKSAGNQVPKGKYFDPITEELYDDDGEDVDRTLPPGWYYDEITDQVYQDDDGFRGASKTAVKKGDTVILEDGDTFTVTRVKQNGEVFGTNEEDGSEFGPYEDHEYRLHSHKTADQGVMTYQDPAGTSTPVVSPDPQVPMDTGAGNTGTVTDVPPTDDGYAAQTASRKTAGQDDNTVGEPTEPNTLNDAVLDGVDKGDADKVSDNIDTNTGDGSDSEGKNGKESRHKQASGEYGPDSYPTIQDAFEGWLANKGLDSMDNVHGGEITEFQDIAHDNGWSEGDLHNIHAMSKADREFMAGVLGSTTHMATGYSPEEIDEMKEWAAAFGYLSNSMRDQVSSEDVLSIIKKEYPGGLTQWNDDEPSSMEDLPEPVDGAWEGTADIEPLF